MLFRLLVQDMIIMAVMDLVDMNQQVTQNVEVIQENAIRRRHFQDEKNIVDLQVHQAEAHLGAVLAREAQEAWKLENVPVEDVY